MNSLTDRLYQQVTDEQKLAYREAALSAIGRGIPKQMIYQYFLQSAYATLEELGSETGLNPDELNQVAVEIAHKLYVGATRDDSESNDNSNTGTGTEHG